MGRIILVLLIVGALALAEGVYYVARFVGERSGDELKRRLRTMGDSATGVQILRRRRLAKSQALNDLLATVPAVERLERLIDQADLDMTVAALLAYTAGSFLAALLIGGLVFRSLAVAGVFAAIAAGLPMLLVGNARDKRAKVISEQLPDALEMMSRAIRAGHALTSSFKLIATECPPPVAVEFAKAYEQQNLGLSFETAVLNMCERVPKNLDLRLFAVSVMIQRETGGNLVEVLDNIARTMRERFKFYSKLRALTAESRISAWILGGLPFVVGAAIYGTNPDYFAELVTTRLGLMILFGGACMWILGIVIILALLQVDY